MISTKGENLLSIFDVYTEYRDRWRAVSAGADHIPYLENSAGVPEPGVPQSPNKSFQWMRDELNQASRLGKTLEDIGGQLESIKVSLSLGSWSTRHTQWNKVRDAECLLLPNIPALSGTGTTGAGSTIAKAFNDLRSSSSWDKGTSTQAYGATHGGTNPYQLHEANALDVDGTFAINQCRPTTPAVELATSVGEFVSEGGKFFATPGKSGSWASEWLNYNLAISPNIATVQDLRKAMKNQDDMIAQYERDAGRLIRRRFDPDFWTETQSEKVTNLNVLPRSWDSANLGATSYVSGRGTQTSSMKTTRHRWFSGAFTYPRPPAGWRTTLQELDHVYGIIPGVATAWELVPYSFVADYFANLGEVLSNVDTFVEDGLVMPFGYIMHQRKTEADISWIGPIWAGDRLVTTELTAHIEIDVRQRRAATPFGFGFSWGDVTLRQLSILASLGLSGKI